MKGTGMMTDRQWIEDYIENNSEKFTDVSSSIWEFAELAFHEFKSAELIEKVLEENGFNVESGIAGIPTAFKGSFSYGTGKPVMGILGEYDALSGLSQEASCNVKPGDVIEIQFGTKTVKAEVLKLEDTTKKENAAELFRYL